MSDDTVTPMQMDISVTGDDSSGFHAVLLVEGEPMAITPDYPTPEEAKDVLVNTFSGAMSHMMASAFSIMAAHAEHPFLDDFSRDDDDDDDDSYTEDEYERTWIDDYFWRAAWATDIVEGQYVAVATGGDMRMYVKVTRMHKGEFEIPEEEPNPEDMGASVGLVRMQSLGGHGGDPGVYFIYHHPFDDECPGHHFRCPLGHPVWIGEVQAEVPDSPEHIKDA